MMPGRSPTSLVIFEQMCSFENYSMQLLQTQFQWFLKCLTIKERTALSETNDVKRQKQLLWVQIGYKLAHIQAKNIAPKVVFLTKQCLFSKAILTNDNKSKYFTQIHLIERSFKCYNMIEKQNKTTIKLLSLMTVLFFLFLNVSKIIYRGF